MIKTVKHYYSFGDSADGIGDTLLTPESWDLIRTHGKDTPFYLPNYRHEWLAACLENINIVNRAHEVAKIFISLGIQSVFSVGAGCCLLEYNIKRLSNDLRIICADYAPVTVERLKVVTTEFDDIVEFDMANDNWPNGYDLFLLHRVDMELGNDVWQRVFERMSWSDAEYILFIPCGLLTLKTLAIELAMRARSALRRDRAVFSGYWRTRETFRSFWEPHFEERWAGPVGDLPGFVLGRARSELRDGARTRA